LARREPRRWRTPFGRWVRSYGVNRLCDALGRAGHPVTPHAVYQWVGGRTFPRPEHAIALAGLSGGEVGIAQIYVRRAPARALSVTTSDL